MQWWPATTGAGVRVVDNWSDRELRALRRLARTHTKAQAAAELGRSAGSVRYAAQRARVSFVKLGEAHSSSRWPASTVAEAVALREQGLTVRAIGARLGVSSNTVYDWLTGGSRWVDAAGGG